MAGTTAANLAVAVGRSVVVTPLRKRALAKYLAARISGRRIAATDSRAAGASHGGRRDGEQGECRCDYRCDAFHADSFFL
jgi:hypothetical protein